ncbi:hypothetical protein FACS189464_4130 [Bacteroidia bacterium]|nr:hypothetical protein FACS189464_4130 [Bacteroidia bacterium]
MKIKLLILLFLVPLFVSAQNEVEKKISDCSFRYGEQLTFRIHYGFITGGEAIISSEKTWLDGNEVFHAKLSGKTGGMIDKIYGVHDIYESFFGLDSNLPNKAVRNIKEGNYRFYDEVTFDHNNGYVESQRKGKVKVPENTLDMVSVLFYLRRMDMNSLKENDYIRFDTYFGDGMFPFYIVYKGKETISISSGKYKCFKFVPIVEPGRIFANEDDMTIWFSDDMNKIPVSIKFDIFVGSFRCDLAKSENLKYPFTAKIK